MFRALTPLQLATGVALGGSVLAVAVPTFLDNLAASRLSEPMDGLAQIAARATALAAGAPADLAYPSTAPLTPSHVPAGQATLDPPGTWDHPTWRRLGFSWDVEHYYAYEFESQSDNGRAQFRARAFGDLDGDGVTSRFEIIGETSDSGEPMVYPIHIHREVE